MQLVNVQEIKKFYSTVNRLSEEKIAYYYAVHFDGIIHHNKRKTFCLIEDRWIVHKNTIYDLKDKERVREIFGRRRDWRFLPSWKTEN